MSRVGYTRTNAAEGWPNGVDLGDLYVPSEHFTQGGLWGWGKNVFGDIGNNTSAGTYLSPIQTVAGGTNWRQVACGYIVTGAIKTDGSLWVWGYNSIGQLGDNTTTHASSPIQTVAGGTNWKQIAAGYQRFAAIKTDGTLWCWGHNLNGQLGDNTTANRTSPVQTVADSNNWKQVACGYTHILAIKTDGTLWNWGDNTNSQLGDNTTAHKSSPVQTVAGGTNWKQVAGGGNHSAAIKTDNTLWLWGLNTSGQLGDNSTIGKSSPVQTIVDGTNWKQVACGNIHTLAIKLDGSLWTWGSNTYGQLGDGSTSTKSSPVQTVTGGKNWKAVAGGKFFSGSLKTDGSLWLWGYNNYGQLGDNTSIHKSSPVQTVAGGNNWKLTNVAFSRDIAFAISIV